MSKSMQLLGLFALLAILGIVVAYYYQRQSWPEPEVIRCASSEEASKRAEGRAALEPLSYVAHSTGKSNAGVLPERHFTVMARVNFASLRAGDFVAYRTASGIVLHRITQRQGDGWVVQGEGNRTKDAVLVTAENYLGIMIAAYAY